MASKLLLISQVFYPDEVSTANLFTNLSSVLVREGVDVQVWCAHPSYTHLHKQPRTLVYNGVNILYLPSTNFKKTNLAGRITNYITFTFSVILKLLISRENVPVFTHTTPPSLGIILAILCSLKKRKFAYILLDIFPEGLIRLGNVTESNILIKIWQNLFTYSLKKSYKIIVIGRDMMKWLGELDNDFLQKTEYIPMWQDDELICPEEYTFNPYVIKNHLQDKFLVQYSGNMGLWNDMKVIGKAVSRNTEGVSYMFVGGGMRKKELLECFINDEQKNVIMLSFQPTEKFNKIITACHVGLVSLRAGLEGMAVPSKIYGIMAAGIPIVAIVPEKSEIGYIINEENCGITVIPGDTDGLINAILLLKSDDELRNKLGQNGRNAFLKKYTTSKIAFRYKLMLDKFCH
ncbi:MAG TPA: hypothetical protein DDY34_01225 [Bacteroidales bacterium]|nr:hypothetical protein [Bacteroidales bacterium]